MKKLGYFCILGVIAIMTTGLVACSGDDDQGSSSDLIGTWQSVSFTGWVKADGVMEDEWEEEDDEMKITFREDGTCSSYEKYGSSWGDPWEGTWAYRGGMIYTYGYDGDEADIAPVVKLTSSTLIVEYNDTYTEGGVEYEEYERATYRKISDTEE